MSATVIEMPKRETNSLPLRRSEKFGWLIASAILLSFGLSCAMTLYLIVHWIVVIAKHLHHHHF